MSEVRASARPSLLGYLGLLPFVAATVAVWFAPPVASQFASRALLTYGAVILTFLGAVHWGLAMESSQPGRDRRLSLSVLPALVAWVALLLSPIIAFPVLVISFAVMNAADRQAAASGAAPSWYPSLRLPLSVIVVFCLGFGWIHVVFN